MRYEPADADSTTARRDASPWAPTIDEPPTHLRDTLDADLDVDLPTHFARGSTRSQTPKYEVVSSAIRHPK